MVSPEAPHRCLAARVKPFKEQTDAPKQAPSGDHFLCVAGAGRSAMQDGVCAPPSLMWRNEPLICGDAEESQQRGQVPEEQENQDGPSKSSSPCPTRWMLSVAGHR